MRLLIITVQAYFVRAAAITCISIGPPLKLGRNLHKFPYRAQAELSANKVTLTDWAQFAGTLDQKKIILAPFCGESDCEDKIKADSTR